MKPEEVPDDLALAAALALIRVHNEQDCGINDVATQVASQAWEDARVALAAVIPLIQAQEREACAAVCEARYMGDNNREDIEARRCAAAIRARGE